MPPRTLPGTEPLSTKGDFAALMVAGIQRYLIRETETARQIRTVHNLPGEGLRHRLSHILGLRDTRTSDAIHIVSPVVDPAEIAVGAGYRVFEVRWPVLKGVEGEGLLFVPHSAPVANVIALPDCDVTPEQFAGLVAGGVEYARIAHCLVTNGCRVLIPLLMDRRCTYSGHSDIAMTNMPHREFIYRAGFDLGRHIIGYEIQKVQAAIDTFAGEGLPIGLFGHGEGGLLALHTAAVDARVQATVVSGYFQPREKLYGEPIYRNLFGLLKTFGDAELAAMISPRQLVIEIANHPEIESPPSGENVKIAAAPGCLTTPAREDVEAEFERARHLVPNAAESLFLTRSDSGYPGADDTLALLLGGLGIGPLKEPTPNALKRMREGGDVNARFKRQFDQLVDHTQDMLREAEFRRAEYWAEARDAELGVCSKMAKTYRDRLWETIGPLPPISLPPNACTRLLYDEPKLTAYEVVLDVYADVFAYGILLVPKRIRKGSKRPVVVCQHGLEGRSQSIVNPDGPRHPYRNYAYDLAKEGFITYAPQNPYIGKDAFRILQRLANPLGLSLFSFIVRQHEQTLKWLASLPFVDGSRIGFYGISYGGKTAMRVPALLDGYCLSICSADYNEWIWKNASTRHKHSYVFTGEYEIFEFNLGNTFNYAEMSWLICPRPFMVERGHHDGVAPDEWVAYEYAKTYRHYALLGHGDATEIEYFNGPHTINGDGTFNFLRKHLRPIARS
jgi:cephalosporin-C deacetylase-like acetyl esterase